MTFHQSSARMGFVKGPSDASTVEVVVEGLAVGHCHQRPSLTSLLKLRELPGDKGGKECTEILTGLDAFDAGHGLRAEGSPADPFTCLAPPF